MEQPSCIREFSRYTVLSVLGTLGVSCYILADTFFVSKGLGTSGLAALNIAIPAYNFIHGTGLMIGMGGATKFSVCKSQGNQMLVDKIYTNTIYLAVLFSIAFMLPGFFCPRQLAFVLGADMTILEMTAVYLRWLLLFSPAFILNDVLLCFVRNDANPQLAMCAMLIGSFFNVIMDYIFIFPLHMGIFGAVFATGISPVISILMMTLHWMKNRNSFHFAGRGICMKVVQWDLSLGFPSLIAQISSGIVMITNSECNARLQTIAVTGLKLYFISTPFVGYNIILATFFTSIERAFPAHILSLLRGLILIIPTAFILSSLWKMTGVWFAYPVTEISAALLGFVIYKNGKKRTACH